jgi:glycosyltransferase involved in cell wall biosynthesis
MKIFVIVPALNEEERIGPVLSGINKTKLPVIVVDDGSTDKTSDVSRKYGALVLRHSINLGKGAAMKTGAEAAFEKGADAVIFMDSDGQHKAEDLPKFVEKLNEGYDIVFGSRNLGYQVPLVRFLGNKMASVLISLLFRIFVSDILCGFRGITKKAFQKLKLESQGYGIETEMVIESKRTNLKYCEVPVATVYYDKVKGVTIIDAIKILFQVIYWRFTK